MEAFKENEKMRNNGIEFLKCGGEGLTRIMHVPPQFIMVKEIRIQIMGK